MAPGMFLFRVLLALSTIFNQALTTRFLPSVIWDNVNPLLCCPYNWLEVPRVDMHDILDLVCPTSKLIVKQVNYLTRRGESMNFNVFRREWTGTMNELKQSIFDGSIHSFCNVSHPDSVKLHTCENGKYDSLQVKFTNFVFDQSRARYEKYEQNKIYIFYSNGNGLVSSLKSTAAKCSMFFAAQTISREQQEFDVTYGKEVVPKKCKCDPSIKPTLKPTTQFKTKKPTVKPTTRTPTTKSTTKKSPTTQLTSGTESTERKASIISHLLTTTMKSANSNNYLQTTTNSQVINTSLKNIDKAKTTGPTEMDTDNGTGWLTIPIMATIAAATFITGIFCTIVFFYLFFKKSTRKEGYNNAYYSSYQDQNGTLDTTLSKRESDV